MKTKRRNYWSFFWRVGAGFLAFWLAVMAGFTLLLGWQTAQEDAALTGCLFSFALSF